MSLFLRLSFLWRTLRYNLIEKAKEVLEIKSPSNMFLAEKDWDKGDKKEVK